MGNTEAHDFAPVRGDERRELNLSRKVNHKQYLRHKSGEYSEACLFDVPWGVRDAVSLYEKMDISFNCLTDIPPEIPLRLPHLNFINISHNQISSLPESFGLLFHMKTVLLNNNKLKELPASFVHLIKLEKLDISNNLFRELPEGIGAMNSLSRLNISHNKLKYLPQSLGASPELKVVLAKHNRLEETVQCLADEGSDRLLKYLRRNVPSSVLDSIAKPTMNVFPRVRGNQLPSAVPNPQSAVVEYIEAQTNMMNTSSRIKTPLLPPVGASARDANELRDSIIGLIYGAAIGDAIGIATENLRPDECYFHYDPNNMTYTDIIRDEHRTRWRQGDWTIEFDQMALVLDSVIQWAGVVDELDFAKRLAEWSSQGFRELGDTDGFVVSNTITKVINHEKFLQDPHMAARHLLESSDVDEDHMDMFADNGAICRSLILGIPNFHNLTEVANNAVRICQATHFDPRCIATAITTSCVVALILQGNHDLSDAASIDDLVKQALQVTENHTPSAASNEDFIKCTKCKDYKSVEVDHHSSQTYKPLAAGLAALRKGGDYRSALTSLIMLGGDSNANGCLAGGLLGAKVGFSNLPIPWVEGLRKKQVDWINAKINLLLDMMGIP